MIQLLRIVQATVINAITIYGVFGANWTVATAIAHGIFLAFFILLLFPKIAPGEAFDPKTFLLGLTLIGGVMVFNFLIDAMLVKATPFANLRATADSFMPRVLAVHLTIIFGMLAMAVFGHPRASIAGMADDELVQA